VTSQAGPASDPAFTEIELGLPDRPDQVAAEQQLDRTLLRTITRSISGQ
jgi:hypothetical protein